MTVIFVLCALAVPLIAAVALMGEGGNSQKVMKERLARREPENRTAPVAPAVRTREQAPASIEPSSVDGAAA
jgi:ribosomal protein L39E